MRFAYLPQVTVVYDSRHALGLHTLVETKRTLAEAQAYQKRVILEADNALAQKLDAEIAIQRLWAQAFAKRQVPTNVFSSGGGGHSAPVGGDGETCAFMQMLTLDAAKRLNYERRVVPK